MAFPLLVSGIRKKRDQMLGIDLGGRVTKAVCLQRRSDGVYFNRFAIMDAPIFEKSISSELLGEHLKAISRAFDNKCKLVTLTLGVNDAIMRHVEMPSMPIGDMRQVLKNNPRAYLQQDMTGYVFDCLADPKGQKAKSGESDKGQSKQKVLVAGATQQLVDNFVQGAKNASLVVNHIIPAAVGPINAFESAQPEVFSKEVVALVDFGFKSSSISVLHEGDLALNRIVSIGGDRLTNGLSEAMNISYAEAEGIKIGMAGEVQGVLESLLTPLARELRASIDFFEHQQDRQVSQVYLSGGSSKSEFIVETMRRELMVECKTWNPTTHLKPALSPEQSAEIEQVAPQLAVAIGAALTAL
jgi:type IV pilus assembly protein PilM